MIAMALTYNNAPDSYIVALEIINIVFVSIFTVEAVMKNLAFGSKHYFKSH